MGSAAQPGRVVRVFIPWADSVAVLRDHDRRSGGTTPATDRETPRKPSGEMPSETRMERAGGGGLFTCSFPDARDYFAYRLRVVDREGIEWVIDDPYRFGPAVDEERVRGFLTGRERRVHEVLGAMVTKHEGVVGTLFAVWAPHALAVNIMGDLNGWDARCHPMRPRGATGIRELFVPGVGSGSRYKYQVVTRSGEVLEKADPCGRAMELRPATASEVWDARGYEWADDAWMANRGTAHADEAPMSVYEVHLSSWKRDPPGDTPGWPTYRELAADLLPYVQEMGFTHVELLPILEHPLDQSWGYQPVGFFAPTSRFGNPDDFRHFVDEAHRLGLGVILDWVPGHFPQDPHGLASFDGTQLYELADPQQALHPDWGTLVFDYAKPAVRSFLVSSAIHWLEDYHLDGLRVDAVASMLYLDYSRREGEWTPNELGGRENLHAVQFLKELNDAVHEECPDVLMIAEESTSWPRVSHGTDRDGLGFDRKWNMGWMNDTLAFFEVDPLFRKHHYGQLTFSLIYAHSERFVLPLSHDEVVHGKGSLLSRMPGARGDQLGNVRALLGYLWAHPGKKLLFMGGELGQPSEWNADASLDWPLLEVPEHAGLRLLVGDLNRLHRDRPALHEADFQPEGFEWLDCQDAEGTTLSFVRWSAGWETSIIVAANLTPVHRDHHRMPVPFPGRYLVVLNTDAPEYGGHGAVVPPELWTTPGPLHDREQFLELPLPGLSVLYLERAEG